MAILLFLIYLVLNGRANGDVLITGAIITALAMLFSYKFCGWSPRGEIRFLSVFPDALMYAVCLIAEIAKANWAVMRLIAGGKPDPYIRSFTTALKTDFARTALANSITLTPGTVTVQLVGDRLTVHCLTKEMAEGLEGSGLEKRLLQMEAKLNGGRV